MRRALRDLGLIFYLLVIVQLAAGCTETIQATAPPVMAAPAAVVTIPASLRFCRPPTPPPVLPPLIRTPPQVGVYANAEAEGRWKTAERLVECDRKRARLIDILEGKTDEP